MTTTTPSVVKPTAGDKTDPATPRRSLSYLRGMLWPLDVAAVQRYTGSGGPRYRLTTGAGQTIDLSPGDIISRQRVVRERVYAACGVVLARRRPWEWDDLARELAAVAEVAP